MNDTTWFWQIVDARGLADVSSDEIVALNELVDRAERCKAAERKLPEAIEALSECEEYFHNRADADCDQDGFIPNKEMLLLSVVRTALQALENGPAGLADATSNPSLSSLRKGAEVAVKPLEWEDSGGHSRADAGFEVRYSIFKWADDAYSAALLGVTFGDGHSTLEEAKSAAQSDFENRIRSALVSGSREDGADGYR